MNNIIALISGCIASYLLGAIPTSFIMAKFFKGIDIRKVGSGNVGATNVLRAVGKMPALITLVIDILKGVVAVTFIANFFYIYFDATLDRGLYKAILGLVVICGHVWTIFLKFKGGKGIATTIGVLGALAPSVFLPSIIIWLIIFFLTNYVSLASIGMSIALPIFAAIFDKPFYVIALTVTICILTSYKHKENIKRLLKGEENKTIIFKRR